MKDNNMKYETIYRNKWITSDAEDVDEMIAGLSSAIEHLRAINDNIKSGKIEADFSSAGDDYIFFRTDDKAIAEKFGMDEAMGYEAMGYEAMGDEDEDEGEED